MYPLQVSGEDTSPDVAGRLLVWSLQCGREHPLIPQLHYGCWAEVRPEGCEENLRSPYSQARPEITNWDCLKQKLSIK